MKLEDQVVSLELSKRLRELGVKQESLFFWFAHRKMVTHELIEWKIITHDGSSKESSSAFTVAELGEMLPHTLKHEDEYKMLTLLKSDRVNEKRRIVEIYTYYYVQYPEEGKPFPKGTDQLPRIPSYEPNEADARAKMLIYLLENKLITL